MAARMKHGHRDRHCGIGRHARRNSKPTPLARQTPVADCIACGHCFEAGKCVFDDAVNEIAARMDEFDGIVVGSPVYYSGPNARLTAFLDRLFFSVPGEKLAGKLGAAVVSCRRGGSTASFERLNQYFLMTNMIVVG